MIDFAKLSKRKKGDLRTQTSQPHRFSTSDITMHLFLEYEQMNPSGFDPTVFMGATLTEANTRRPPLPAGATLIGTLGEAKITQAEGKKETNLGVVYTFLEIPIEFDMTQNPTLQQHVGGLPKVTLSWKTRLDVTPTGFDMQPGKNNGLRQLREALDMNKPGDSFNLLMIQGRRVLCTIKNDPYQNEVYDGVGAIARVQG